MMFLLPESLKNARILVTNDDGIHAEGINVLANVMAEFSDDVWIVAPELEQSGAGHSLTLHQPLRARQLSERRFTVSGTPTDCVLLGSKQLIGQEKPLSLLVSGINHGDNMAEHVTYSGTIAAAMEGALLNIPSIAFSRAISNDMNPLSWETSAYAVRRVIEGLKGLQWAGDTLLSVNIPDCNVSELKDIRLASQGTRSSHEAPEMRRDPRGRTYYWIGSSDYGNCVHDATTDCALLQQNHITLTPLCLNLTNYYSMDKIKQHLSIQNDAAA